MMTSRLKSPLPAVVAVAVISLAGACATLDPQERRVTYACERGGDITVVFAGDTARVIEGGNETVLQREPVASGFSYVGATRSLRGQGDEVMFAVGRMAPTTCRALRPEPR